MSKNEINVPVEACNELGEQIRAFLSEDGRKEIGDPVPVAPPAGLNRPLTTEERFRRIIRSEHLARIADAQDVDTFDESDDFDIPDDPESAREPTPHEIEALEGDRRNELRRYMENERRKPKPSSSATPAPTKAPAEDPKPARTPQPAPATPEKQGE